MQERRRFTNFLFVCETIPKRFLRFASRTKQREYAKALAYYFSYDDSYLSMKNIDIDILLFLTKIVQNNFTLSKNQITKTTAEEIENYFSN